MAKVTEAAAALAAPIAAANGCTIWDVEYVRGRAHGICWFT
jgi:ribosome maturation factor RimP